MTDKSITWEELATLHDKFRSGRRARTLPMNEVFDWAVTRPDLFIEQEDGTLSLKESYHD